MEETKNISSTSEKLILKRKERAKKIKNRILTELYRLEKEQEKETNQKKKKITIWRLYRKINSLPEDEIKGKTYSRVYDQIRDLEKRGVINVDRSSRRRGCNIELTELGRRYIKADTHGLNKEEVAIYLLTKKELD